MKQAQIIQRELHRIGNDGYPEIRVAVREYINTMQILIKKEMMNKFAKVDIRAIADDIIDWEILASAGVVIFKQRFLKIIGEAGLKVYSMQTPKISIAFDVVNKEAVKIADKITNNLVVGITKQAKKNLQYIIKDGIAEGKTMYQVAKSIRKEDLGIVRRDYIASQNYKAKLKKKYPKMSAKDLNIKQNKYIAKKYRKRCDVIARTETSRAVSEGSLNGYEKRGVKKVEFVASAGACELCGELDGTVYKLENASNVIPVHPSCKCSWVSAIS